MGRKKTPGLYKRGEYWHIVKQICGQRICESIRTSSLAEAEKYLTHRIEQLREAKVYGVRPARTFKQAATKYLLESQHKAGVANEATYLAQLDQYIGNLNLEQVHIGSLQPFIKARLAEGRKIKTVNLALAVVRHILNLAASE